MQTQAGLTKRRSIASYTLWSLAGCGIGAVVAGVIGWFLTMNMAPQMEDPAESLEGVLILGLFLVGAGAGAGLGLALKKRRVPLIALGGAFGFIIGIIVAFIVSQPIFLLIPPEMTHGVSITAPMAVLMFTIRGALFGAFGGAVLGLVLRGWKGAGFLSAAGAIAGLVVVPVMIYSGEIFPQSLPMMTFVFILGMVLAAVAMGAALGAALGYLEKREAHRQGQVN